ncbi:hypothetical protein OS493_029427 [Desmophyllum pertusum]|uniref:HECT domain-containing protein n=1 Tax=Desmophyllum pertusum TaxID=174260 RepID=A0A9W9YK53_9CNID|nr:hypothetical protein OS493_029427 [Desmophyllum pertusum]
MSVNIQVGIMKNDSIKRGETLPLRVLPSLTPSEILEAAIKKHKSFNKRFNQRCNYILVYRDGSEVDCIPGVEPKEPFTLKRYKEAMRELEESLNSSNESADSSDEPPPMLSSCQSDSGSNAHSDKCETKPGCSRDSECKEEQHAIQCPTCYNMFAVTEIEEHADLCSSWLVESIDWDPIQASGTATVTSVEADTGLVSASTDVMVAGGNMLLSASDRSTLPTLHDLIVQLHNKLAPETTRINVRRKTLWQDYVKERKRKLKPEHALKVVFLGEPAIDDGGPRREFFSDMLEQTHRKYFPDGFPTESMISLTGGDFRVAGEIMAMSVIQGGPAPNFLAPVVFSYLSKVQLSPHNNSTQLYKDAAIRISSAKSDKEIQELLVEDDILEVLEKIGYQGVPQRESVLTAQGILRSICVKDQLSVWLPQLMQLEEGLNVCGLLNAIQQYPDVWKPVFQAGELFQVSAEKFLDEAEVQYSSSQFKKEKEMDTYKAFCDAIQMLEDGGIAELAMCDFLKWLTGTRSMPPLGFPKKFAVRFVHGCMAGCQCRPSASTCDLVLKLPVHIISEDDMKVMITSALKDSIGFTLV